MNWKRLILILLFPLLPVFAIAEEVARAWTNMQIKETTRYNFRYWKSAWNAIELTGWPLAASPAERSGAMLTELLGRECACDFDMPTHEWPTPGFPAWVVVDGVDMPMVKLRSVHGGKEYWINAKFIKKIAAVPNVEVSGRPHLDTIKEN